MNEFQDPAVQPSPSAGADQGSLGSGTIYASVATGVGFLVLLGAVLGGLWYYMQQRDQPAIEVRVGPTVPDEAARKSLQPIKFKLVDSAGQAFDSDDLKGEVWAVNFFFASCPGPCFLMNQQVGQLQKEFGPNGIRFVSITVAPESDTPQILTEYAERLGADPAQWHFLTGDTDVIEAIGRDMFLASAVAPGHSERLYVVDREGKWRDFSILNPVQFALARAHIRSLLGRKPAPAKPSVKKSKKTDLDS